MALKGKKKSKVRGSQARRRPAAAPRPTYKGGHERRRWYQTTQGLVFAFLIAMAAIIFVWWFVANSRSDARELETRQEALKTYTNDLRATIDALGKTTGELGGAATLSDEELLDKAKEWKQSLTAVQSDLAAKIPPEGLEPVGGLFSQSVLLYGQSAELYEMLPDLEGAAREKISAKATATLSAASSIFASAIQLVDGEREDAELPPSGLSVPPSTPTDPGASETIELPTGDSGGEGDGDQGNG